MRRVIARAAHASLSLLAGWIASLGCVGDDPIRAAETADASPGDPPSNQQPEDSQPSAPPKDAGPGGDDASPSEDAGGCTPLAGVACQDPTTLVRCRTDGAGTEVVACAHGCSEEPTPHCALVVPTGIAPASDFTTPGLANLVVDVANVIHSDTGEIEGKRSPNPNPLALFVSEGIGFHVVTANDHSVGVFVVDKLTIQGTMNDLTATPVRVVGTHPVVFLAKNDVTIVALSVAADCTTNTPGPGGFAGGIPGALRGGGPGGGAGGSQATFFGGAGGGGHGDRGGNGAGLMGAPGGAGGLGDTDVALVKLIGGSGGGATPGAGSNGGAGGGAVQIVSQTRIAIGGGIAAGGCGGRSTGNGAGGGGAGGAILLEAPTVSVGAGGFLVAGGGGGAGGGSNGNGNAAAEDRNVIVVGSGGFCSIPCGGNGAHFTSTAGGNGIGDGQQTGAGGGAIGRVRINTLTGAANLSSTNTLYAPPISWSNVFTQGLVAIE